MKTLEHAREYLKNGYPCIPAREDGKEPAHVLESWLPYAERMPTEDEITFWFAKTRFNVGIVMGSSMRVDFDVLDEGRTFFKKLGAAAFKTVSTSPKGIHFWFRPSSPDLPTRKFRDGDLKYTGYCLTPPSVIGTKKYEFVEGHGLVHRDELPVLDPNWFDGEKPLIAQKRSITRGKVRDALAYAMRVESIQGMAGSHGLIRFFVILKEGGYTEAQAMAASLEWQKTGRVVPEWSIDELARACSNTYAKVNG